MASLLDTLDRFNYTTSSIRSLTASQPDQSIPGPFTSAILNSSLEDILREADEAEYGLFTFVKDSSVVAGDGQINQGRVGRKEFRGATPLKQKRAAKTNKDEEPEVYVEAALKYLDRFRSIKSMPHIHSHLESLIDRLNTVRDNIERLQTSIDEQSHTGRISPKSQIAEEERRISELKSRVLQLRKRKEALASKLLPTRKGTSRLTQGPSRAPQTKLKRTSSSSISDTSSYVTSTPTVQPLQSKTNSKPSSLTRAHPHAPGPLPGRKIAQMSKHNTPSRLVDDEEDKEKLFWSGGKPPKVVDKTDSLLDEELDMTGMDSIVTPIRGEKHVRKKRETVVDSNGTDDNLDEQNAQDSETDDDEECSDSGEPTIVVSKLPRKSKPTVSSPAATPLPPSRPHSQASTIELQTPIQETKHAPNRVDPPSTKTKIRRTRITPEMERVKIWNILSDLLVPGNNFNSPGKGPPNAKNTLAILQAIASQPIADETSNSSSPSSRSTLSSLLGIEVGPTGGSPHQIMTALVLLTLLTAPNRSIPFNTLKGILASKIAVPSPGSAAGREAKQSAAALTASATQIGTRALYGCVAKQLVKIDRGGGEQIVKFD